jgi:hypothetical protein
MPEKGRWDSIIGTNWYWPELLLLKKSPEITVPRRCRSHVLLKYIVLDCSFVMQQHVIVQFLTLRKLSARGIKAEFDGAYGHEALSLSAVKKWRKRFVNGRITLKDTPRSGRPSRSDLCEFL